MTSRPLRRSPLRLAAALLATSLAVTACSGSDDDQDGGKSADESAAKDSSAQVEDAGAGDAPAGDGAAGEPAEGGVLGQGEVEDVLDQLGTVLRISLPDVKGYEVDADTATLTVQFSSGSKDDLYSHCLVSAGAAGGLGLPADYELIMSYPDGDVACGE